VSQFGDLSIGDFLSDHIVIDCIQPYLYIDEYAVFLSGQAGLSGGFQMRAGPGLVAFPAGLAAFLGGLSLNRIFCSKDSLLPILRKSPKYET
jgi:hypothetical protein